MIAKPLSEKVLAQIGKADELYHRLVLIAAPSGSGKTTALQDVATRTGARLLNLNLELSRGMLDLDLTERQRALQLPRVLEEVVGADEPLVLLDNIEILFDVTLKQDPLRLLQGVSRNRTVVAAWNGTLENGYLSYATPGHPEYLDGKLKRLRTAFKPMPSKAGMAVVTIGDCARLSVPNNAIDYVFTDPPFGENIYYADLNCLVESWHRVLTRAEPEAIVDRAKKKRLLEYQHLMQRCFEEYCRVLKPGRWMTVVFHNSKNAVWNAIQEAMLAAGFVVADVRTLDKKQGSYRQVTSTAVKQDLVISAYKPNHGLEERFKLEAGTEDGVWDFIRTHMRQLPVFPSKDRQAEVIAERQNYLLFDRMVAFHVQRGVTVPLSAAEFYEGLAQRFSERDGMYFLPEQVAEYDRKRMTVKEVLQLQLFVKDEETAIQWLKQQLTKKPQTFQEIHPHFMKELGGWEKHEKSLELAELLEQNLLRYDGAGQVPSQIHSYLSSNFKELRGLDKGDSALRAKARDRWYDPDPRKAGDLEKLRDRTLLKEFDEYRGTTQKKLKVFRLEAVRAGFKRAWQERDYATIIAVARKIPEPVLQEDPKLLMWFDQALTRSGEEA